LNLLRWRIIRKILAAIVQVQTMENRIESDVAYTYDWLAREERKVNQVNQLFNVANFLQFGVLYTIEPYLRINKKFENSATLTCTGACLGILLPVSNIMYNKFHRPKDWKCRPYSPAPSITDRLVQQPATVCRALHADAQQGSSVDREEELKALWKQRYHVDFNKPESLGCQHGKPKGLSVLNRRIVLLWSLFTAVQDLDEDLLVLQKKSNFPTCSDKFRRSFAVIFDSRAAEAHDFYI